MAHPFPSRTLGYTPEGEPLCMFPMQRYWTPLATILSASLAPPTTPALPDTRPYALPAWLGPSLPLPTAETLNGS